jgi:hypothetical protein
MTRRPSLAILLGALLAAFVFSAQAHDPTRGVADAVVESGVEATEISGEVRAYAVDNASRGTSHRYVDLELADGTDVPLEGEAASRLLAGERVRVSGKRNGKVLEVESVQALGVANPSATKASIEVEGKLAVLHADDFATGKSRFIFEVHDDAGRMKTIRLGSLPRELAPGMRVRVQGHASASASDTIDPERILVLSETTALTATETPIAKAATANSVLVIMANFSNTAIPAFTAAQAQQVMTTNADSVANFFREASYGQQLMNVTVTPNWVRMNLAQPTSCGNSDWQAIGASAEAAAKSLGGAYDPASYNFVVYLFPSVPACGWLGLGYIGNPHKAWINGPQTFRTSAIAHEMGHNFGLLHAASVRCAGSIGGSCTVSEYGDPFDTMGNQSAMHYNAMQKAKLNWIASSSVVTHAGGAATYTLSPIEAAGGTTYAVKIPTGSGNRTYWLEFRQPLGFDAGLSTVPNNGAQIRVASPFETLCSGCDGWSDDTQLLDMTPSTSAFSDAALVVGKTFSDPAYGVNISVLSATASALTLQVATGGATTKTSTTTSLAASPNPSFVGSSVTLTASVTGNAPTGAVRFSDGANGISGCTAAAMSGSGDVRTASCVTSALAAGTHGITAQYSGDAANTASTSASVVIVNTVSGASVNVALATNGGVASASSTLRAINAVGYVNDNRRSGAGWSTGGGGWADATSGAFPDWVQIAFAAKSTIDHVVVYSVQDNYQNPVEPSDAMTFTKYGLTSFQVQGWSGAAWVTLASVTGNNLVKRTVTLATPYTTDRIRIVVNGVADGTWSRITEIEAWTSATARTSANYALAANGGVASASSTLRAANAVAYVDNGERSGAGWSTGGGGWADATPGAFPDWVQINLAGAKALDHVVVYSVQDQYQAPIEPTDSMTFSLYGITAFQVQGWNGTAWTTLGTVSGNRLVKRSVAFSPFTTDRIRVLVTGVADNAWSRITEIEAWGQ